MYKLSAELAVVQPLEEDSKMKKNRWKNFSKLTSIANNFGGASV